MNDRAQHYVESLPGDLDTFLADFFPRRKWHTRVQYDHRAHRFFLDIVVSDSELAADDRFLSLLAFYGRGQRALAREKVGLDLNHRLFSAEGVDLTPLLRAADAQYLSRRGSGGGMSRRLAWLGVRNRIVKHALPRALLWAATVVVLVLGFGFSVPLTVMLCLGAALLQTMLIAVTSVRVRRR